MLFWRAKECGAIKHDDEVYALLLDRYPSWKEKLHEMFPDYYDNTFTDGKVLWQVFQELWGVRNGLSHYDDVEFDDILKEVPNGLKLYKDELGKILPHSQFLLVATEEANKQIQTLANIRANNVDQSRDAFSSA